MIFELFHYKLIGVSTIDVLLCLEYWVLIFATTRTVNHERYKFSLNILIAWFQRRRRSLILRKSIECFMKMAMRHVLDLLWIIVRCLGYQRNLGYYWHWCCLSIRLGYLWFLNQLLLDKRRLGSFYSKMCIYMTMLLLIWWSINLVLVLLSKVKRSFNLQFIIFSNNSNSSDKIWIICLSVGIIFPWFPEP